LSEIYDDLTSWRFKKKRLGYFRWRPLYWKREITLYLRDALVLCSMKDNSSNKNEITAIIPSILYANRCDYYTTINILDSDWTKHYFTLHFKMWLSPLKSAHEVNITFEHCSVYSKIVFENVFSDWSIFKEAVLLSNQRFPINSLYYIFLFYVYRTLFSFSRHFVCFEFYSSSGGKFQVTGE
jgi:hypothetical protein